jgi:hypothetical protein
MMILHDVKIDDFVAQYLRTVLWAETVCLPCAEDELVDGYMDVDDDHPLEGIKDGESLDSHFGFEDFTPESVAMACLDCDAFRERMYEEGLTDLAAEYKQESRHGHDFWLTRNGHGAGFWDGDYGDYVGDRLTDICREFGECGVLVGEDGSLELCKC